MGIYTDYGRYMKARQFRNWAMSGAGIWFGFGIGSPRWDFKINDSENGNRLIPNVPTSAPASFTSVYRWFTSYKNIDPSTGDLAPQEYALIDTSYVENSSTLQPIIPTPNKPTNAEIKQNSATTPSGFFEPAICWLDANVPDIDWEPFDPSNISSSETYPSPYIPPFPIGYRNDWEHLMSYYDPSQQTPPSDPTEYEAYAYWTHFNDSVNNPLGFLSFIQGMAHFVEPLDDDTPQTPDNALKTFKYGANQWRIVPDSEISFEKLPHHVLLTVNVFPNDLSDDDIAEQYLHVRQVSVFKFPDIMLQMFPDLNSPSVPRSAQVLKRKDIWFIADYYNPSDLWSVANPTGHKYVPYGFDAAPSSGSSQYAEMLINDFMTARIRSVQQTDRYGYIVGF